VTGGTLLHGLAARARHWRWRLAFVVAMFGTAAVVALANQPKLAPLLVVLPALFGLPMWREAQLDRKQQGEPSPALAEHDLRTLMAVFAYIACMGGAVALGKAIGPGSPWLWLVALLPILPILAIIWTMGRYLAEETDEFLRHRAVNAALIGLAAVLVLATVWGTLELFGLVPHAASWWLVPAFAVARDAGKAWLRATGR
jgi:hypothetical protein